MKTPATLGLRAAAIGYLLLMLVIPFAAILQDGFRDGVAGFMYHLTRPAAVHAIQLTLWTAVVMSLINAAIGTLTAYVLVRYPFPGKSFIHSLIDLPFAIPTLVTGVMLVVLYGPQQPIGKWFQETLDWKIIFAPPGIILALLFVSFPLVVRTVQPVLMEVDRDQEEVAQTLGATSWTTFRKVLLPAILPSILTGTLLSFARAIGEFGSVVVVAGNFPFRSQTAALYVLGEIESENQRGASAISLLLLVIAFLVISIVDWFQRRKSLAHV